MFLVSKDEEITMPNEFIFVFFWYFIGPILSKKSCQKWGIQKKDNWGGGGGGGGWPYKGLSIEEGDSNLLYTMLASLARSSLQILEESYDRGISNFQISGQIPSKQKLP